MLPNVSQMLRYAPGSRIDSTIDMMLSREPAVKVPARGGNKHGNLLQSAIVRCNYAV